MDFVVSKPMFPSYKYSSYLIALGYFFIVISVFNFSFKCQTIFKSIPELKSSSPSLGYECFALFFMGEAFSYIYAEFLIYYVGYRITFKISGTIIATFFALTLYCNEVLIKIGAFFTGIALGHMWISIISFLKYSRSHPWNNCITKLLTYTPILVTASIPIIGLNVFVPDDFPNEIKPSISETDNDDFKYLEYEHIKTVIVAKIFYEHLIEYLMLTLCGTFIFCAQPRLWKIVGIKTNSGTQIKLTLVDYNNKNDDFSKSIKSLYLGKRRIIAKSWKSDLRSIPFILFNQFMIAAYIPVFYVGAMTAYIGCILTAGITYGDFERDITSTSNYLTLLIMFICVGRGSAQYWVSILEKEKYNKNRRRKHFALLLTLFSFLIITIADGFLPGDQVDLLYGIINNKLSMSLNFLAIMRLFAISILAVGCTLSEYYIYGYFEIIGQVFGSKVTFMVRALHCISTAAFVLLSNFIPFVALPMILSIFLVVTTINYTKAERFLIKSIFITQGVSQTTITKLNN
uniref:Protein RFT1 homolog n=1 Tax=Parastrongyloides trichosuri TaxID=131310 RepID=A0A0N4ZSV4_PARTI